MQSSMFKPGQLPGNEYAMTHMVYLNPADFTTFLSQSRNKEVLYLDINSFVMKAEKLKDIPEGQLGVSKFHREGMSISKHDDLSIKVAKI